MAAMPPSGSSTSPLPVRISITSLSATIISASRLRRYLSVRQSLASSTAARISCPLYCSSFRSSRSNKVKASAVAPANPPMTSPFSPMRRTFFALGFITVLPIDTWPSPAMTVFPPLRTPRIVVPCQLSKVFSFGSGGGRHFDRLQALFKAPVRHQPKEPDGHVDRNRNVGGHEGQRHRRKVTDEAEPLLPAPAD